MSPAARLAVLLLVWPLSGAACIKAEHYDAFWVWGGIHPQPVLESASRIYLVQAEQRQGHGERFFAIGPAPHTLEHPDLWLVFRSENAEGLAAAAPGMLQRVQQWEARGTVIRGVQIDFDARSRALSQYATQLADLRAALPDDYRLSITGLLDWATTGSVEVLNGLRDVVDEIVIQTYQGVHTVPEYAAYLPALARLQLPFRIGLVQYGDWNAEWETRLARNDAYLGAVVFLLNRVPPASGDTCSH